MRTDAELEDIQAGSFDFLGKKFLVHSSESTSGLINSFEQ